MAINFDALPKEKPEGTGGFALPEPGMHKATVESTAVKPGSSGPYLEVVLKLESGAKIWDRIVPSDKAPVQYKIGRFLRACRIPLTGEMELVDLGNVIVGKTFYVDVMHRESDYNGKKTMRAEIDIFTGDIYYLPEDLTQADTPVSTTTAPSTPNAGSY